MRTTSLITVAIFALTTTAFPTSSPPSRPTTPIPDEKCTFALHQRQQSSITYIQLNTIQDHANNITIDIASQRPPGTFNSYIRLDEKTVFAVTGLLDDERLTITLTGKDDLAFGIGREKWGSWDAHAVRERGSAWCEAKRWEGGVERRERWLECGFSCERSAEEDLDEGYAGVSDDDGQALVALEGDEFD